MKNYDSVRESEREPNMFIAYFDAVIFCSLNVVLSALRLYVPCDIKMTIQILSTCFVYTQCLAQYKSESRFFLATHSA